MQNIKEYTLTSNSMLGDVIERLYKELMDLKKAFGFSYDPVYKLAQAKSK